MGWIDPKEKMPPSGLLVLLEVSGYWTSGLLSDHDYELGCWLGNPDGYKCDDPEINKVAISIAKIKARYRREKM